MANHKLQIVSGQVFTRWTVLDEPPITNTQGAYYYACRCVCGKVKSVRGSSLVQGHSKSCGCLAHDARRGVRPKTWNGNLARKRGTMEYFKCNTWGNLLKRTGQRPNDSRYSAYYRKGIERRFTKDEFYAWCDTQATNILDIYARGETPSIDRIDSNGHYEFSNMQILTHRENIRKH